MCPENISHFSHHCHHPLHLQVNFSVVFQLQTPVRHAVRDRFLIRSVVVTQSFGWLDPGLFGSFSLSMMTMVQVCVDYGVIVRFLVPTRLCMHVCTHASSLSLTHMPHITPIRS